MSDWREYTCEYKWPNRPQLYKHLDLDWNLMCGKQNITDQEASNKTFNFISVWFISYTKVPNKRTCTITDNEVIWGHWRPIEADGGP